MLLDHISLLAAPLHEESSHVAGFVWGSCRNSE